MIKSLMWFLGMYRGQLKGRYGNPHYYEGH